MKRSLLTFGIILLSALNIHSQSVNVITPNAGIQGQTLILRPTKMRHPWLKDDAARPIHLFCWGYWLVAKLGHMVHTNQRCNIQRGVLAALFHRFRWASRRMKTFVHPATDRIVDPLFRFDIRQPVLLEEWWWRRAEVKRETANPCTGVEAFVQKGSPTTPHHGTNLVATSVHPAIGDVPYGAPYHCSWG